MSDVAATNIGSSNAIPNSVQQLSVNVPCYCGYPLQEGDDDKKSIWGGEAKGGAGNWVSRLQSDLIAFGIVKNGILIEKKIPQLSKTKKNKKTGKIEKIAQPPLREWQKATLLATGVFDEATTSALKLFQWHAKKFPLRQMGTLQECVDVTYAGNVDGVMSESLCAEIKIWKNKKYQIVLPELKSRQIKVDANKFRELYESNPRPGILTFEKLPNDRFLSLKGLLDKVAADVDLKNIRWAAYMFATLLHECRSAANQWKCTWTPVAETSDKDGKYNGGKYGDLEWVVDGKKRKLDAAGAVTSDPSKAIKRQYYGRGFVQLTHQDNYRKFGDLLGIGVELQVHPDKVLEGDVAYKIMSIGMRDGKFRGTHKLSDYLSNSASEYVGAREIINGDKTKIEPSSPSVGNKKLSNGQLIAHYADIFEWIFYNSLII